ncbi:MAG: alanine racemase [Bacillota bacterium]
MKNQMQLSNEASAWIEIEAEAILHNLGVIKKHLKQDTKVLAVVKANAYGHGALEVARLLSEAGIYGFGVTNLTEGIALRKSGIHNPLLLFAPLLPEQIPEAVSNELTITVSSISQLKSLQEQAESMNATAKVHVKLETGMGRTGLWPHELEDFINELKKSPNIQVEGIYSHLSKAGTDKGFCEKQFSHFLEGIINFESQGINIPIKHIVNSAGLINYPHMHLDMVRSGTLIFGQIPAGINQNLDVKDPWKAKAKIIALRKVPANWPVGYGADFVTKRESLIGALPIGFADGLNVSAKISPKGIVDLIKILVKEVLAYFGRGPQALGVTLDGKFYPFIGRIGMQLSMVDFTGAHVKEGSIVEFPLRRINAPMHLPRIYLKKQQPYQAAAEE